LTEVKEELVKLLLVSAVQNEVGSEDKDTSRKDRQDFQSLKANNPVQEHAHLDNFWLPTAVMYPLEGYGKGLITSWFIWKQTSGSYI